MSGRGSGGAVGGREQPRVRWIRTAGLWLAVGLTALLAVGVVTLQDYGTSIDEWHDAYYGRLFLHTVETGSPLRSPGIDYFNGPFYFMVFSVTSRVFHWLAPSWLLTDGIHLTNFLTFLLGVFFLYRLALRLFPPGMALFICGLFVSQPLLFGHALINQKDTPLMVLFLMSVETGLAGADRWLKAPTPGESAPRTAPGRSRLGWLEWTQATVPARGAWLVGAVVVVTILVDLWFVGAARSLAQAALSRAYEGQGSPLALSIFRRVAQDAYKTPLQDYLEKLDIAFVWLRLAATPVLAAVGLGLWRTGFPAAYEDRIGRRLRRLGPLALAGCVVGVTTSVRLVGPFAGLLVAIYLYARGGRRALSAILGYAAVGGAVTFLTWPALWGNPFEAFAGRALQATEFVSNEVFFDGSRYEARNLPWTFLPFLLAAQATIPAVALFVGGAAASILAFLRRPNEGLLSRLIWVWFLLPFGAVVLGLVPIYNNFRHVLFILPAAFLIAGHGVQVLARGIRSPILAAGLGLLALAPGAVGIVRLHPYEYVYYNEWVGGVAGAFDRFELDYWCTAFRKAMEFVDAQAPPGARVAVARSLLTAAPFAREDLTVVQDEPGAEQPDLALACRRNVLDVDFHPEMRVVYEVRVEGALLATVRQRR